MTFPAKPAFFLALPLALLSVSNLAASVGAPAPPAAEVRFDGGRLSVNAQDALVTDVLDLIAQKTGATVVYEGTRPRARVKVEVAGLTVAEAVERVLQGLGVAYMVQHDRTGAGVASIIVFGGGTSTSPTASVPSEELAPAVEPSVPRAKSREAQKEERRAQRRQAREERALDRTEATKENDAEDPAHQEDAARAAEGGSAIMQEGASAARTEQPAPPSQQARPNLVAPLAAPAPRVATPLVAGAPAKDRTGAAAPRDMPSAETPDRPFPLQSAPPGSRAPGTFPAQPTPGPMPGPMKAPMPMASPLAPQPSPPPQS
jgi:hypothetical protein